MTIALLTRENVVDVIGIDVIVVAALPKQVGNRIQLGGKACQNLLLQLLQIQK